MLNQCAKIRGNLFLNAPIVELSVSFLENSTEYLFEIKYDIFKKEYVYERFAQIQRDKHNNIKIVDRLVRDSINADLSLDDFKYLSDDEIKVVLKGQDSEEIQPQEKALSSIVPVTEMLHLASVYKGVTVPNAYLYSLAEFTAEKDGVRDTSDLIEKYRRGVFGALPKPDLFQSLLEVKEHG